MNTARSNLTVTLPQNGQVLVAGGYNGSSLATSELYNPTTGMFSLTGSMTTARNGPAATLLADGEVLVVGGADNSGVLASAELYAPPNWPARNRSPRTLSLWH